MGLPHVVAIAAIPATLLLVSNAVQGTAQSLDAIGIHGNDAESRIRTMAYVSGGAIVVAAGAASVGSKNFGPIIAASLTAVVVVYLFDRITLSGKGLPWLGSQTGLE